MIDIDVRYKMNLSMFDQNVQTTEHDQPGNDLSPEMKTYYDKNLIRLAGPSLIHDQFGDKRPIPRRGGKRIEFRKPTPLDKQLRTLTEGVTPPGNSLDFTDIVAQVKQFGDYVTISDLLDLTAIDPVVLEATKMLADQAGRTLDTITREELAAGTQVMYAPNIVNGVVTPVESREEINADCRFTADLAFRAAALLKALNAPTINGSYVAIIHPHVAYDIMRDNAGEWIDINKYSNVNSIFNGEVGKLGGVRFVESTEAKIFGPAKIGGVLPARMTLRTALSGAGSATIAVAEEISAADAAAVNAAITGGEEFKVYVGGKAAALASVTAGAAGAASLTVSVAVTDVAAGAVVCGYGGGADGSAVYGSLVLGRDAYAVTELEGGGLEHLIKQRGSGGTSDPLNQRSTVGWKATKTAVRLIEQYILRVEVGSTFSLEAESN